MQKYRPQAYKILVTRAKDASDCAFAKVRATAGEETVAPLIKKINPCGCFVSGTLVLTSKGYKEIQDIKEGDLVWAYNDTTSKLELKEVIGTFSRPADEVYHIYIKEKFIEATQDHPFFIGGKWIEVDGLKAGDKVKLYSGEEIAIDSIIKRTGSYKVFNFTVKEFHTYYVSKQNILVHNGMHNCDFGFAWQRHGSVMTDVLSKGIHGDVYHKSKKIGEVSFELSADGRSIVPVAVGKPDKAILNLIMDYGNRAIAENGFNQTLLNKVNTAINSGQIKSTTDRYQKLVKLRNFLQGQ